jgi:conjugal transfer mating pair stabilization protein TraN
MTVVNANLEGLRRGRATAAIARILILAISMLGVTPAVGQGLPPVFGDGGIVGGGGGGGGGIFPDPDPDPTPECDDGVDNDNDGLADLEDPGCEGPDDTSEADPPAPACRDGEDNDGDGLIDQDDPGCAGTEDNDETDPEPPAQCGDGEDNDNDGLIDMDDPGCATASDDDEEDPAQCEDGRDNDGDGLVDLDDPGCSASSDPDETDPGDPRQCQDGFDNDEDGLVDMDDPGCSRPTDHDETDPPPKQCEDGYDNDGDGLIDLDDPGCDEAQDGDETDPPTTQCNDGIDNDGDGKVDGSDPGCKSSRDNNETDPGSRGTPGGGGYGSATEEEMQWAIQQGREQSAESRDNYSDPTMANGDVTFSDGTSWNSQEINQYENGQADEKNYFPDGYEAPENDSMWQEEAANEDRANEQKRTYTEERGSQNASMYGMVYDMAASDVEFTRPDMRNDPIITASRNRAENNQHTFDEYFGDCSSERGTTQTTRTYHNPDYRQCNRVLKERQRDQCEITHAYQAELLRLQSGPANIASCGEGCMHLWLGQVGDDYYGGNCSIYEDEMTVAVVNPEAITSATIEYAKWDDYLHVYISGDRVWAGPNENFPPETGGACELATSWSTNPNVDVTSYFSDVPENSIISFKNRLSVTGRGEGYARLRIQYDPEKVIKDSGYTPDRCVEAAQALDDGRATGNASCTAMPPTNGNGCTNKQGVEVCPHNVERLMEDINPLCERIAVDAQIQTNRGPMECYTDAQGVERCPYNEGESNTTCEEYEANPNCAFVEQQCMENGYNDEGECVAASETWDCGYDVEVEDTETTTTYECEGPTRCMGDECVASTGEDNGSFNEAVAALQVAQMIQADAVCISADINQNNACKFFAGTAGECKTAVGGTQDCCENPESISWVDYMKLMSSLYKIDGMIGTILGVDSAAASAYAAMPGSQAISNAAGNAVKPFTNAYDAAKDWFTDNVEKALEEMLAEAKAWVQEQFGEETAQYATQEAVASEATSQAGDEVAKEGLTQQAMGAANFVMTAYSIYVATVIAIQMIYECEEEEFQLNAKKAVRACHYVGSYCNQDSFAGCIEERRAFCCFNSPLGRILQQQIRPQFNMSWGSAEYPDCGGITAEQLSQVDWSQVDLSEWIAMMAESGTLPDGADMSMEDITGDGHSANVQSHDRDTTPDRMEDRMENVDDSERRQEAYEDTDYNTTGD